VAKNRRAHSSRKDILKQIARAEVSRGSGDKSTAIWNLSLLLSGISTRETDVGICQERVKCISDI
jgi:hypothetical protein